MSNRRLNGAGIDLPFRAFMVAVFIDNPADTVDLAADATFHAGPEIVASGSPGNGVAGFKPEKMHEGMPESGENFHRLKALHRRR